MLKMLLISALKILSNKYKNKIINITGRKVIKIKEIINYLIKKFKINKNNIKYKNEKDTGHYVGKPR